MNVMTAAWNVAEDYAPPGAPGGAKGLAKDIGENPTTFNHALHGTAGAALRLTTAVKMTKRAQDLRILHAFAAECGQMCIPLPESLHLETSDCMRRLSEASEEFASLCKEALIDLGDNRISDNELHRLNTVGGQLIQAVHGFLSAADAKNKADKPAASV
jgi:hypothetical protein